MTFTFWEEGKKDNIFWNSYIGYKNNHGPSENENVLAVIFNNSLPYILKIKNKKDKNTHN